MAHPEYKLSGFKNWRLKKLKKMRAAGVPFAYLTGHKEFFGFDFLVNKHVLIPRPETELMVELVIDRLKTKDERREICLIDIGTGSGCVAIAIEQTLRRDALNASRDGANTLRDALNASLPKFYAIDISRAALKVAKTNARKHNTNITFLQGHLLFLSAIN